jgi:hypothetical protein
MCDSPNIFLFFKNFLELSKEQKRALQLAWKCSFVKQTKMSFFSFSK